MESSLLEKVSEELEMLESIYIEDNVIAERALSFATSNVECTFNLQPNTGQNSAKIAVTVKAKFAFTTNVCRLHILTSKLM